MSIVLVPIGRVDQPILKIIGEALSEELDGSFSVAKALPHPDYAYNEKRAQYLSDAILAQLSQLPLSADRLLGIVDLDLYTPGLNFVFGQASLSEREAIIALPRLRQEFYGLPSNEALFHERAIKEAIHELGHTCGLGHCPNSKCVMHFSNSLADTDAKGVSFCPRCRRRLSRFLPSAGPSKLGG
ncbi:MAG: archaemetzincin family Zn-dependent metalloprotease [Chloroflexota bacterium]|nr:archaemetzincin family Zn-dependent metalloprotease [Chloroflexota bacterium]